MYIYNKTQVHRGVNFADKKPAALTLEWTSDTKLNGGDFCVLLPVSGEVKMTKATKTAVDAYISACNISGLTSWQDKVSFIRSFIYFCWQGAEETHNTYVPVKDTFVKLSDVYGTIELKDITEAQFAEIKRGDCLVLDENGFVGTSSITTTGGAGKFKATGSTATAYITGTIVTNVKKDTDGKLIISFVC